MNQAAELHTTTGILAELLGSGFQIPDTPRLTVFDNLTELLDDAVQEQAARAAEVAEYGHTSAADVRRFENLNPFLLRAYLVPLDVTERHRLDAVARAGTATDTDLVVLGPWPAGCTVAIDADRVMTVDGPGAAVLDGATAFGITTGEAAQILQALSDTGASGGSGEPFTDTAEDDGQPPAPRLTDDYDDGSESAPKPAVRLAAVPTVHRAEPGVGVLMLNLMGPFTAEVDGRDVTAGFQPAHRTLLLYLALRQRPAPRPEIIDTLWLDDDAGDEKARAKRKVRFDSRLHQTRKAMAKAAGYCGDFIAGDRGLLALNRALVATDLACFDELAIAACKAADDTERIAHLEAACALYRGPLDETIRGDWLLEHREDRLRRYRDAAGDLARVVGRTDRDRGLAILNRLLEHDLFNEDLYRRIMRGQAELKRFDAVRRTFDLLEKRFEANDMEIDPDTRAMVQALTRRRAG